MLSAGKAAIAPVELIFLHNCNMLSQMNCSAQKPKARDIASRSFLVQVFRPQVCIVDNYHFLFLEAVHCRQACDSTAFMRYFQNLHGTTLAGQSPCGGRSTEREPSTPSVPIPMISISLMVSPSFLHMVTWVALKLM